MLERLRLEKLKERRGQGEASASLSYFQRRSCAHEQRHKFETKNQSRNGTRCSTKLSTLERILGLQMAASFPYPFSSLSTLFAFLSQPVQGERTAFAYCDSGFPGSSNPATNPHAFPGTIYQELCGSSRLLSQAPNPPGREKSFRLTSFAQ